MNKNYYQKIYFELSNIRNDFLYVFKKNSCKMNFEVYFDKNE